MDEFNAGSNKNLNIPSIYWWECRLLIQRTAEYIYIIYRYITIIDENLFGHSNQSLLFIFIQGTFLLNDHPVTLAHRFDDDTSSINLPNNTNTHRDYQRNNINELRLRDWDCYKVKKKCQILILIMIFDFSVVYKILNDVISVLIVIYRVKVCGKE
jgi:hypothetical protein